MSQQVPKGTERVISALVKDRADKYNAEGEEIAELDIESPFFQSQYPSKITMPRDMAQGVLPNRAVNLVLKCGNLKKKRDGTPHDGEQPWHYYWDFVRWADADEPVATTQPKPKSAPETTPQPQTGAPMPWDSREVSIQRQVAAKITAEVALDFARANAVESYAGNFILMYRQLFPIVLAPIQGIDLAPAAPVEASTTEPDPSDEGG